MINGVNKNENQGEDWNKMLHNGQMTDFGENIRLTLDHIISGTKYHYMIETTHFFCWKSVTKIELGIKGPNGIRKCQKGGQSQWSSLPPSSMGVIQMAID